MAERPPGQPQTDALTSGADWLIHHLPMGVIVQDAQGRILEANPAALDILGLRLDDIQGQTTRPRTWTLTDAHGAELGFAQQPAMQAFARGEVVTAVLGLNARPDRSTQGPERWLNVTALPHSVDTAGPQAAAGQAAPLRVYSVFEDVTASHSMRLEFQRSEERYRALVAATSQYVWTNNPDGRMDGEQPDWAALTGQSRAQYRGYGWAEALHPDDRAYTLRAWEAAVAERSRFETEHRVRTAGGEYRSFSVRAIPLLGAQNELLEWVGLHTDVTPLRTAEAALKAMNAELEAQVTERSHAYADLAGFNSRLLSSAGEGIFGLDGQGRAIFTNPAAATLLGYTVEELEGQPMHSLIHARYADGTPYPEADCPVSEMLRRSASPPGSPVTESPELQSRRVEGEVFWRKDGTAMPVEYVVTALPTSETAGREGESGGAVLLFQDVTGAQQARAALERAITELERSNRELEQFAYVSSHDLQEPLRTVGSYAELLSRRYQGKLDPRADQYLGFMQDAVARMRQLINDLLSFSRIGKNELVLRPVPLEDVMREVRDSFAAALGDHRAELSWQDLPVVQGNAVQLGQLMGNLVSNALKFRRADAPPRISVKAHQDGAAAHLTVTDNGIGIDPEYQERVFGLFQRLHRREEYEGTGLGLAICRKIVQAQGGEIWLESEPGTGTVIHLRLPLAGAPEENPPERPPQ
ncbi:PAS domain S-box protein [Deinococcus altitudinis]|uniref:PAS domain-containing sensor histidine kinase n=1 Tax=Deinococcus altitudinis TaxID=468914 RepID=UPI0038920D3E